MHCHRNPINLGLDNDLDLINSEQALEALVEIGQFLFGKDIIDTEHLQEMLPLFESVDRFATNPPSWRVWRSQFWKPRLKDFEVAEHLVVVAIRDVGIPIDVIQAVVTFQLLGDPGHFFARFLQRHLLSAVAPEP